jgi:alpha-methylacyl-CoA racemase
LPAPALRFAGTPVQLPAPAPSLGADSRALMQELGLAAEDIDALVDQGVIADH